jgi:transposase
MFTDFKIPIPDRKGDGLLVKRWGQLMAYLNDGHLNIDNNLVENAIRPVALGRKNYLFAGTHDAVQRAAMIYSFFAICKKHDVNPYAWWKNTLQHINPIQYKNLTGLYPHKLIN